MLPRFVAGSGAVRRRAELSAVPAARRLLRVRHAGAAAAVRAAGLQPVVPITRGADGILLPRRVYGSTSTPTPWLLASALAVFALSIWITGSPFGYALKAIRNDEQAAEVVGVRIFPVKLQRAGAECGLRRHRRRHSVWSFRYIDPRTVFGLDVALIPVAMALLGGSACCGDRWSAPCCCRSLRSIADRQPDDAAVHHHRARHPADRPLHAGRAAARAAGCSACRCWRRSATSITSGSPRRRTGAWPRTAYCRCRPLRGRPRRASLLERAISPWRSAATSPSTGST